MSYYDCWTQEEPHLSAVRRAGARSSSLLLADGAVSAGLGPVLLGTAVALRIRSKVAAAPGSQDPQAIAALSKACIMSTSTSVPRDSC